MIVNSAALSNLFVGYKAAFQQGFNEATPDYTKIATEVPSATAAEDYAWLGEWPRLREWIGDRVVKDITAHKYTVTNKSYEATVGVPKPAIADDTFGVYKPMMQEMGRAARMHPDEMIFSLLSAGFSTPCYDGQYFFDTDHPILVDGVAGTVSNMQAGTEPMWALLDTSRALRPLIYQKRQEYQFVSVDKPNDESVFKSNQFLYGVDGRGNSGFGFWQMAYGSKAPLTLESFRAACEAMGALKSDEGRPLNIKPTVLVHGPSNRSKARDLILAATLTNGQSNTEYQAVDLLQTGWLA